MNYLKQSMHRNQAWLRAVASIPCVQCGKEGQTQAAHRNLGKGMALKTDDCLTAALCIECHRIVDQGHEMTREMRREMIDEAIRRTWVQLAREGLIRVV